MNTLDKIINKHSKDPFDKLIFEKNLRSKQLIIEKELDVMIVLFNNGAVLQMRISDYPKLKRATVKQLQQWTFTGGGVGIRWELLDEDLSIKGFIKTAALNEALRNLQGQTDRKKSVA